MPQHPVASSATNSWIRMERSRVDMRGFEELLVRALRSRCAGHATTAVPRTRRQRMLVRGTDRAVVPTVSRDVLAAGADVGALRAAAERWAGDLAQ